VLAFGLKGSDALETMRLAAQSPHEVSGIAHLPVSAAARSQIATIARAGEAVTALRVEGPTPSVRHRAQQLIELIGAQAETHCLGLGETSVLWTEVRDVAALLPGADQPLWRLVVPPAAGAFAAEAILNELDGEVLLDWGGGLLWLAVADGAEDAGEAVVRETLRRSGGNATLVRAAEDLRRRLPVFQPQPASLRALTRRIKDGFDPKRVLEPGRMYEGL
jgi:glycolate oxidase FAD binding subunit